MKARRRRGKKERVRRKKRKERREGEERRKEEGKEGGDESTKEQAVLRKGMLDVVECNRRTPVTFYPSSLRNIDLALLSRSQLLDPESGCLLSRTSVLTWSTP